METTENVSCHGWEIVTSENFFNVFNSVLPLQECSLDCGLFCLIYSLYLMFFSRFDVNQADMLNIRYKLFQIVSNCCNDPALLNFIESSTRGPWTIFKYSLDSEVISSTICSLPTEITRIILLKACEDNWYTINDLKEVCDLWNKIVFDSSFVHKLNELELHKALTSLRIHNNRRIFQDIFVAMEWLLKNVSQFSCKISLPDIRYFTDMRKDEVLDYILNGNFRENQLELEENERTEWENNFISDTFKSLTFVFQLRSEMRFFLNAMTVPVYAEVC